MSGKLYKQLIMALCFGLCFTLAGAVAINLTPTQDNTLYENNEDNSNGKGAHFFAGRTHQTTGRLRRALLKFDLSGIPAGSTITNVSLQLRVTKIPSFDAGSHAFRLHRVSQNW